MQPLPQPVQGTWVSRCRVALLTVGGLLGIGLGVAGFWALLTAQAQGSAVRIGAGLAAGLVVVGGITAVVIRALAPRLAAGR
ncbi:MAG TPA: hypothetical protein VI316_06370 [Candidatus Dormibacteraeota bacterium]